MMQAQLPGLRAEDCVVLGVAAHSTRLRFWNRNATKAAVSSVAGDRDSGFLRRKRAAILLGPVLVELQMRSRPPTTGTLSRP